MVRSGSGISAIFREHVVFPVRLESSLGRASTHLSSGVICHTQTGDTP